MDIESFREYCLTLPGTTEGFPFDGDTLVFYVEGKMYALTDVDRFESINLNCDPEVAIELRERHANVLPGYHMNKKHWNTVLMDGSIADAELKSWIHDSYLLVIASLPKKVREKYKEK